MPMIILNPKEKYIEYLKILKDYKPRSIMKAKLYIEKVEYALGYSVLECKTGSQIEAAIIEAAKTRKKKWNGGHIDDGQHIRHRLGINTACYLKWAHRENLLERNPYPENTFRKPPKTEALFLTDEKIQFILSNPSLSITEQTILHFVLDTGVRRQELCDTKITDLNLVEQLLHIPRGKGAQFRTVTFTEKTRFWLELYLSMRKPVEYLFSNKENMQMSNTGMGDIFKEISIKVGFRVPCHSLRHTAGRIWAEAGVNQGIIQRFLGHTDPAITSQYIHSSAKKLREIQKEISDKFLMQV